MAATPRPIDRALRQASWCRLRSKITIADSRHELATTGNRISSGEPERLETAYAKATPPPATSRTKGANHGALRCVCVDIVRASMMKQAASRLHHPTGVNWWTGPRPSGGHGGSPW